MSKKQERAATMFAQITKVDEAKQTVTGRMVQEVPDKVGEIFDYESSKPHFQRWQQTFSRATGGKSLGNVRAMHGPVAAGKITDMTFHDAEKAIDITTKIVDKGEWAKVLEGVYTGFSIGGKYIGKPVADGELMRYTASPDEVSLVDNPCVPTAMFFDVHKADGSVIHKNFVQKAAPVDTSKEDKDAKDADARGVEEPDGDEGKDTKPGGDEDKNGAGDMKDDETKGKKAAGEGDLEKEFVVEGSPEDLEALHKAMQAHGLSITDVTSLAEGVYKVDWAHQLFGMALDKVTFADPANKRFPIDTEPQVRAAMYYASLETTKSLYEDEDDYTAIVGKIKKAWEEVIGELPEDVDKAVTEADLAKSFYLSAQLCGVVDSLTYMCQSAEYQYAEGARADLAVKCRLAVKSLAQVLSEMVTADTEALSSDAAKAVLARVDSLAKLADFSDEEVKKIGARNNKTDLQRIQRIHDLSVELGAKSPKSNPNGMLEDEADKAATAELEKLAADPKVQKLIDSAVAKVTAGYDARIKKLEEQPLPTKGVLRAVVSVAKRDDIGGTQTSNQTQIDPVRKADGGVDEVATDIKAVHKSGGQPLFRK